MDRSNFSFMKSGFDNTVNSQSDDKTLIDVASMIATFTENAMITAGKYVEHAGRKVITAEDICACLKGETFRFVHRDTNANKLKDWKKYMEENIGKEDDSDTEDDEDIGEEYTVNTCTCEECNYINSVCKNWDNWEPTTPIEKILKSAILGL